MASVSCVTLTAEGAQGVNTVLLAASVHRGTLIHVYRRKTDGQDYNVIPMSTSEKWYKYFFDTQCVLYCTKAPSLLPQIYARLIHFAPLCKQETLDGYDFFVLALVLGKIFVCLNSNL